MDEHSYIDSENFKYYLSKASIAFKIDKMLEFWWKTGHFWEILQTIRVWLIQTQFLTVNDMPTVRDWLILTQFPTVNDMLTVTDWPIPNG